MDFLLNGITSAMAEWKTKNLVLGLLKLFWLEISFVFVIGISILFKFHTAIWTQLTS